MNIFDGTKSPHIYANVRGEFRRPDEAQKLAEIEAALEQDKAIQHFNLAVATYQKGRDYTNFIIVAGYAAFFALWSDVAKDIDRASRLLSGGLLGLSLVLFITWEIVKMVTNAREGHLLSEAIWGARNREDLALRSRDAERQINLADVFAHDLWPAIFIPTVLSGLVGALVLVIAALAEWAALA
jgi:hypothetical protein